MEETIIPELPVEAQFAREQAAFITTTLDWLLMTHEHQYRYAVVENVEYRNLLSAMLDDDDIGPVSEELQADIGQALAQRGPLPDEAAISLRVVAEQNRNLKHLTATLFTLLCERSEQQGNFARMLLAKAALSQGRRERAFYKGTGFTTTAENLAQVLGETEAKLPE